MVHRLNHDHPSYSKVADLLEVDGYCRCEPFQISLARKDVKTDESSASHGPTAVNQHHTITITMSQSQGVSTT
jgi:hypothetical protein